MKPWKRRGKRRAVDGGVFLSAVFWLSVVSACAAMLVYAFFMAAHGA